MIQVGTWMSKLPFAVVMLGTLGYAVKSIWSATEQRPRLILILVGLLVLSTSALQEYFELEYEWESWAGLRGFIEEGTEIRVNTESGEYQGRA